ncbi:MAG: CoA transferase, partial [Acidimicrobiaceae bacterium]|nr:CoA transferase [Acidimicrobiaceae bacterium]
MPGALANLRIIDFGQYVAGPLAALMLADQGAEVIHVDPPGGPRLDGPADAFLNRNKRRVILDLASPVGRDAAARLIGSADVVIENFRPGVMDRLGLGPDAMTSANPGLVYCSLPGFSAEDPRAGMRAWEGVLQAATANSIPRRGEEPPGWDWSRPTYTALPLPSSFAAYLGATSIVMALIARWRTGRGQRVEVPLFDAMFTLVGHNGAFRAAHGASLPSPIHGRGAGCFRCADGRYVQFDTSSPRHLTWFAREAGVTGAWGPGLLDLIESRKPDVNEKLHAHLAELFLTRPAEEWEAIGNRAGAAIGMVRTPQEWIKTDQARAIGAVTEIGDPVIGPMWMAGLPVQLSKAKAAPPAARHLPGEDTTAVLSELETRSAPALPAGREPDLAHPLAGVRVVDLCIALAGPTCGRLLSEFGADVIKINAPGGGVGGYLNRGKRSLLVDLDSLEGQEVYWRLVEKADVVVENFSPSTSDRLGIGYAEVSARRPDIVYTSMSCYGRGGPWTENRGWERQGQAVTGIMERTGLPSVLGPYNIVDIGTGIMGTFATGLGLYHRLVTGSGQMVGASLVQTATYHQALFAFDYPGHVATEPRGYDALGEGPLDRYYPASDAWFYLAAQAEDIPLLADLVGAELVGLDGPELEKELEAAFRKDRAVAWVERLRAAGIAAHPNTTIGELMTGELARARGLSITQDVDGAGPCVMPGISVHLQDTPARVGQISGPPGA